MYVQSVHLHCYYIELHPYTIFRMNESVYFGVYSNRNIIVMCCFYIVCTKVNESNIKFLRKNVDNKPIL